MPSNFLLFDRVRALAQRHQLFQAERTYQDQTQLDRMAAGGQFYEPGQTQNLILDQTNLQLARIDRYKDYEQMDQMGEISLALDLYADEASLVDPERKHTIIIRAHSRRLKKELEEFLFGTLLWDNYCRPTVRYLCKFGCFPSEIVPDKNRTGVSSLRFMNVYNFTRIETAYGDLVGFFYQDELRQQPVFMHPWQVMHLRLTSFENAYHPYGKSVLDGGRKKFKQLRLMEDAALVYRITRAPEKRKFTIPVGFIPPKEVPEYMQMIARTFKRQRFYNTATGNFDERYSPLIQEDDFFLPRRPDGTGPDIETLPGAENLDQIKDIEYFKKGMIAPMKIPFARVGIGEGAGEGGNKPLSQESADFAKAVQWVQREVVTGLTKVCIIHLALRGYRIDDIKGFELAMSATNAMEELYRMETWQTRVGVMMELKELAWFPKEWIITHFTDLTPDEIQELKEIEAIEAQGGDSGGGDEEGGGGGGGGGAPPMGGGMDDLPPVGGDDAGGEDAGGDMGGEPGPGGPSGMDLGEGDAGVSEAWDRHSQRRVLQEIRLLKQRATKEEMRKYLVRLAGRMGKDQFRDERKPANGYDQLIESKELDALSNSTLGGGSDDPGLLVEWSVPKDEREAAIATALSIITADDVVVVPMTEEVGPEDLPHTITEVSDL